MILISCKNCHQMYEKENYDNFVCTRCNHIVRHRIKDSLQVSLALTICAILLYIPAMIYPIMEITQFGVDVQSTILEGVISFLEMKSYFIAIVIFTASVVIPLIKLVGLLFIFISLKTDVKNIFGDSKLILEYWSKGIGKLGSLDERTVELIKLVKELRITYEQKGGKVFYVSGVYNPADLGFHR